MSQGYDFYDFVLLATISCFSGFIIAKIVTNIINYFKNPNITIYCLCFVILISFFLLINTFIKRIFNDPLGLFKFH